MSELIISFALDFFVAAAKEKKRRKIQNKHQDNRDEPSAKQSDSLSEPSVCIGFCVLFCCWFGRIFFSNNVVVAHIIAALLFDHINNYMLIIRVRIVNVCRQLQHSELRISELCS